MRNVICISVAICLLAFVGSAWGTTHKIELSQETAGVNLLEQTNNKLTFRISVGELAAMDVETKEGTFSRLLLPGFHSSQPFGQPELPMLNQLFEIPYGAEMTVEVLDFETREFTLADYGILNPLMPAQPSVAKDQDPANLPFHYDQATYARNEEFGFDLVKAVDTGQMRAVRIGRLEVAPVTYNPQTGTVTVKENVIVAVHFTGGDLEAEAALKNRTRSPYFDVVYGQIAGSRDTHDDFPDHFQGPVTYIIVADRMFEAQLQPFIQWQTERGFKVIVGYTDTIGSSTSAIQSYIHGLYASENPAPTFVLFVGDTGQIPAYNLSGYSDLPYCDTTGDDVPEMYYGRFSANNSTELQPYIDKTMEYEKHEFPDPSFLGEVVMIAGYDSNYAATYGNGQINYGTNHYFNAAHGILSHTYLYPESGSSSAAIIANVSDGVAFINYTAHGGQTSWSNPSFTITNINNLTNNHKYCLAVGNCCLTGSFQVTTCFGEAWLRAPNKGAIGYIGGSASTYWDEDYWFGVGYGPIVAGGATYEQTSLGVYDGMFHDHGEAIPQWYIVQDAHIFCGNLAVQESGTYMSGYYWDIYNLMGDPSLSIYLGVPDANAVTLPPNILPAATYVTVIAEPHSYVGFTADGVLLGGGMVDADGTTNIPISDLAGYANVHVVITCQNKIPYITDIPVMTMEGPYLIVDHNDFNDYSGDQDGEVDAGEHVQLVTYLENMGGDPATNVTGVLAEVRGVTITDADETWGTINPGQIKPCDDSFKFLVGWSTPDQTQIDFTINLSSSEDNWDSSFSLIIDAPVVEVSHVTIDDASGNGNGMADPGETVGLTFNLTNSGHEDCRNIIGTIWSGSEDVEIHTNEVLLANLPEGGTGGLTGFSVTIDPTCPEMSSIDFHLCMVSDLGHQVFYNWDMPVAPFFDDFEVDMGWTVSGTASRGHWERADPEETTYNGSTVQPGDDHTPAPGVNCWVTGPLAGSAAGSYDVDGGSTILTSTVINLAGLESVTLEYWRWYTNNLGNGVEEDWWNVEVSDNNGVDWVYLEHTQSSANEWTRMTFQLEDYIDLTSQVIFRFTASDEGLGSLVEAAVDDLMLYGPGSGTAGIDEPIASAIGFRLWQNSPNAANPATTIRYRLDSANPVPTTLKIYSAMGRLVRTLVNEPQGAGNYNAVWDGRGDHGRSVSSGIFFYVLNSGEKQQTRKMVVVQ